MGAIDPPDLRRDLEDKTARALDVHAAILEAEEALARLRPEFVAAVRECTAALAALKKAENDTKYDWRRLAEDMPLALWRTGWWLFGLELTGPVATVDAYDGAGRGVARAGERWAPCNADRSPRPWPIEETWTPPAAENALDAAGQVGPCHVLEPWPTAAADATLISFSSSELKVTLHALEGASVDTEWGENDRNVLAAVVAKLEAVGARSCPWPGEKPAEAEEQFEPLEELQMHARPIAALFVDTFGCPLDPGAHAEWSAEKWRITSAYVSPAARALGHDIYQAALVAETRRLAAGLVITDDQLRALGRWARSAGNDEVEELCTYALDGDLEARAQCAEVIARENG